MRRIGIVACVSLVIALFGLPAGVQAQGGDDGVVAEWHFEEGFGGVPGKIKVSSGHYFTMPGEAVMECLEERGEEPDRCLQTIESGDNVRSIEVRLTGNEVGTHEVESEVYYQFRGSPKSPTRYETLTLIVPQDTHSADSEFETRELVVPGFGLMVVIIGLLAAYLRRMRI